VITDYESGLRFLKFKIADPIWQKSEKFFDFNETCYSGVFGVAEFESDIFFLKNKNGGSNMADEKIKN